MVGLNPKFHLKQMLLVMPIGDLNRGSMTAEVDAVIRGRESKPPPKMVVNEWGWRGIHSGEHDTVALKIVLVYIPRDDSGVDG
ncbi:hypothetical protein V6N11_066583 [Hibiscus sabdariffa]|uniref:Uncharacterized protein n=1 Tax=Hibiscus sabdariffa TaxID=183260 RepID=A0ABR2A3I8_9ROSI